MNFQTNTYQGVVVTDGQFSYSLFIYNCDLLTWSGGATIGFNADGIFYENHKISQSTNVRNVACLNLPDSAWSNVLYQLCKSTLHAVFNDSGRELVQ